MTTLYFKTTEEIRARRIYAEKEYKKQLCEKRKEQLKELFISKKVPESPKELFLKKLNKKIRNQKYLINKKRQAVQLELNLGI
jgi:hypothetical protein